MLLAVLSVVLWAVAFHTHPPAHRNRRTLPPGTAPSSAYVPTAPLKSVPPSASFWEKTFIWRGVVSRFSESSNLHKFMSSKRLDEDGLLHISGLKLYQHLQAYVEVFMRYSIWSCLMPCLGKIVDRSPYFVDICHFAWVTPLQIARGK